MTFDQLLRDASHRDFVGRKAELDEFRAVLERSPVGFHLVQITGDAGSGKSMLLRAWAELCRDLAVPHLRVDVSCLPEITKESLTLALRPWEESKPRVVLIDAYEELLAREAWFLDEILARFTDDVLLVLASRVPFGARWSNLARRDVVTRIRLKPLSDADSLALLEHRGVDPRKRDAMLRFARGSPLLLALSADVAEHVPELRFGPHEQQQVLKLVLDLFRADVVEKRKRDALGLCAVARFTTFESLHAVMEGDTDLGEVFAWLRSLSFIEDTAVGLRPHSVVRNALLEELKQHQPATYLGFHRRLRGYYRKCARIGVDQARWVSERVFLDRELPALNRYFDWQSEDIEPVLEPANASQKSQIVDMVRRWEGEESALWAKRWFLAAPEAFEVCLDADGRVRGFLATVQLGRQPRHVLEVDDPAVALARSFLERAELGSQESALFFRFWMTAESHRSPSPVTNSILTSMMKHLLRHRNLAFHFALDVEGGFWTSLAHALDIKLRTLGRFVQGTTEVCATACRWRDGTVSSVFERPPVLRLTAQRASEPSLSSRSPLSASFEVMIAHTADEVEVGEIAPPDPATRRPASQRPLARALHRRVSEVATEVSLSQREREVLELALIGRDAGQIGVVLGITPRTAKFHLSNLFAKLGAESRADLLRALL